MRFTGQLIAAGLALTAGIVGTAIEADAAAHVVIIVCLRVPAGAMVATATWAYVADRREGQDRDSRYASTMDTMRVGFGDELPPLPASGTIQADTRRSSRRQRIRTWLATAV